MSTITPKADIADYCRNARAKSGSRNPVGKAISDWSSL